MSQYPQSTYILLFYLFNLLKKDLLQNQKLLPCILYIPTIIKHKIFLQIYCLRFTNVMNNATIINIFKSDNISNHDNHYKQTFEI